MFKINKESFILILKEDNLFLEHETNDYIMKLKLGNNPSCTLYLKEIQGNFEIAIIKSSYKYIDNKYIIKYLLESDEEESQIEIEMEKE